MRVVIVNPSSSKTQTKAIKNYFPKEVTQKDILDSGGLEVDYDASQSLFYVYKNDVTLAPSETKTFEIVIKDVWMISEDLLSGHRKRVEATLDKLKGSPYIESAQAIADTITARMDEIIKTQNDPAATKQQHIAYYRGNIVELESIKADIDKLEKILVAVGGPPNLELIEKSDINLKSPSSKTTWVIIFIILIFVAILSGTFYLTWMRQAKLTENIFMKEKDTSFSEFKNVKTDEAPPEKPEKPKG
jgi:hypothetical protein